MKQDSGCFYNFILFVLLFTRVICSGPSFPSDEVEENSRIDHSNRGNKSGQLQLFSRSFGLSIKTNQSQYLKYWKQLATYFWMQG